MTQCVFCDIIEGRQPASVVYEDETSVAFMDIFPVHPGHMLVIPRVHAVDLVHCPPDIAAHLFEVSARLAPSIVAATDAAGFNVWTANGKEAGQEVFHLHLHILPRYENDTFGLRFPKGYPTEASREELEELAAKIRQTVGK
jgi:histidine triad (HIT) family protein